MLLLMSLWFGTAQIGVAHAAIPSCFNFKTKITTPLQPAPTHYEPDRFESKTVKTKEGDEIDSAKVSGVVPHSVQELYRMLLDPKTIRNGDDIEVSTQSIDSKDYLKKIIQTIQVTPVFFLTIEWKETWAYALKDGTEKDPKTIVISYEKTDGTSHIDHLCGNIVLQSLGPTSTGVFLYQEMKADRRDAKDLLNDLSGTLRTLRGEPEKDSKKDAA